MTGTIANMYLQYLRFCRKQNNSDITEEYLSNQTAKVMFTALHIRSGWYCLCRHIEAICLTINKSSNASQAADGRWLIVSISNTYNFHSAGRIFTGLPALFHTCKLVENTKMDKACDIVTRLMMYAAEKLDTHSKVIEHDRRCEFSA